MAKKNICIFRFSTVEADAIEKPVPTGSTPKLYDISTVDPPIFAYIPDIPAKKYPVER